MKSMKPFTQRHVVEEGHVIYVNTQNGTIRKRWWTKARIPGTVRKSRMSGGSGFRNNWEGEVTATQ